MIENNNKRHFAVDSQGNTEVVERQTPGERGGAVMHLGNVSVAYGTPPKEGASARLYMDPGGRIIDTKTGEAATHGDGNPRFSTKTIADYEK